LLSPLGAALAPGEGSGTGIDGATLDYEGFSSASPSDPPGPEHHGGADPDPVGTDERWRNYDWLSPDGHHTWYYPATHYDWYPVYYPQYYHAYYKAPDHHRWYTAPIVYTWHDYYWDDPWWVANVYGMASTTIFTTSTTTYHGFAFGDP
jgi:hypothetical protein